MSVPLLQRGITFGAIVLTRTKQQPFDEGEISLIEGFADQAVIALENVRQFREVQTRLERETAAKNVLGVIAQSIGDELPVFDAILANVTRLCNAPLVALVMVDQERTKYELVASKGTKPEFVEAMKEQPPPLDPERFAAARAIVEKRVVHVEDLASPTLYGADEDHRIAALEIEGIRTTLFVPLIWNAQSIGAIGLWRREVKPFREDEITLIETFSAQAVIAIENVRQFREVQDRLAREAATSEVLNVISLSRSDAQPVFRSILENAARLCSAPHAMLLLHDAQDEHLVLAANNTAQSVFIDQIRETPHRLDNTESYAVRAVLERKGIHVRDLRETVLADKVPQIKVALDLEGMRTVLQVPLVQGDRAIGVIALYKLEVAPLTDDQIKLVETFAAQAVIAIESTNQLQNLEALNAELGERVEQQVG